MARIEVMGADLLGEGAVFASDYRVLRPLSSGGMGSVFVVEQVSTGAQPALASSPRLRERFEQEARVSSRIQSDHVVSVLSAGVDAATNQPYLVMELLEGRDLATASTWCAAWRSRL